MGTFNELQILDFLWYVCVCSKYVSPVYHFSVNFIYERYFCLQKFCLLFLNIKWPFSQLMSLVAWFGKDFANPQIMAIFYSLLLTS